MTESDYIFATNLAKLRIAERVLRDVIELDADKKDLKKIIGRLYEMIQKYEVRVAT